MYDFVGLSRVMLVLLLNVLPLILLVVLIDRLLKWHRDFRELKERVVALETRLGPP